MVRCTPSFVEIISDSFTVLDSNRPVIVLAIRRDGKPSDAQKITTWQQVPTGNFIIKTMIAEKAYLRVEDEGYQPEGKWSSW